MDSVKKKGTKNGSNGPSEGEKQPYPQFAKIDGRHDYRQAAPDGYVDYHVHTRKGGTVFYFNFDLAKEMGLIPKDHPYELNRDLARAILHTFSIQIINEYDIQHGLDVNPSEIRPHKYMATRYLQLQHPNKQGKTSGDGRAIWNGTFRGKKTTWDISSSGTGATCLSPAVANEKRFFKTGDKAVGYGNGRADLLDGICTAVMSDIFHRNKIKTERTLTIIAFEDGTSINVRVYKSLLRPAHFFRYIKLKYFEGLKSLTDFYIDRQIENGEWPKMNDAYHRYQYMLEQVATNFARTAAQFESEYIFCWLDWDGDNVLVDGAIIDYGSVRQFGLFHHEYRYDDVERMSTNIREQKGKAKYIVQTFAQIVDYLITGKEKNIRDFAKDKVMKLFDQEFEREKDRMVLYKMGFSERTQKKLMNQSAALGDVRKFRKLYSYFEMIKARRGRYKVSDGVTWDAIYCVRNIMRELPKFYIKDPSLLDAQTFNKIMISSDFASRADAKLTESRTAKIRSFQKSYWKVVNRAANITGWPVGKLLKKMVDRSAIINRYERVTGDSILKIATKVMRSRKAVGSEQLHAMINEFVEEQILRPGDFGRNANPQTELKSELSKKIFNEMLKTVKEYGEGL